MVQQICLDGFFLSVCLGLSNLVLIMSKIKLHLFSISGAITFRILILVCLALIWYYIRNDVAVSGVINYGADAFQVIKGELHLSLKIFIMFDYTF